ncbi:OsmC family protein [Mesorhizobium sp. NPDC059054]|uniref:OsmC family protein n=1 Tax=Mesorhizobium sp. NPDC059054 TaxID=3346711 RepID=UPI0036A7A1B9
MTETALDPDVGSRVEGRADETYGRVVLSARSNHLISDGRASQGAPGEAISAGELLLASLVSCGLGLVHASAREREEPRPNVKLTAEFLRDGEDPTRFASLTLTFQFKDAGREKAELYVAHFTSKCPIYNTLKRGGSIDVIIEAAGGKANPTAS